MLARRAHTWKELERKLLRKGFQSEEFGPVLEALAARGYLDDAAAAASFARTRAARGIGARRIASELARRGVGRGDVEATVAALDVEEERAALLRALERKRASLAARLTPTERSKKLFDHLVRRGFAPAAVLEALRKKGDSPDDPA